MPIDMIVTDVNLGGSASGWDVARRFRSEQPNMPVIYISGEQIDPEHRVLSRRISFVDAQRD
jgi:CheY-like chemotaxis protein